MNKGWKDFDVKLAGAKGKTEAADKLKRKQMRYEKRHLLEELAMLGLSVYAFAGCIQADWWWYLLLYWA